MDKRTKSLCRRAQRGDREAACELVKTCYPDVFAYLRRLCGSQQDAEDLTQQTFLRVWSSLGNFSGRSRFSTWLHAIAYHIYIDWQRQSPAETPDCSDPWWQECADTNPGPLASAADRQTAQRLYEAVDQLDEDQRHIVHLHYYQQLSIRQTAKVLNVATSTVKYRLREVLKILRTKVAVEEDEFSVARTAPVAEGETS